MIGLNSVLGIKEEAAWAAVVERYYW